MEHKAINYRLFLFEIIFACLIVLCHVNFQYGDIYIDSLGRSGVLFFFIVSAYFYNFVLNKDDYRYANSLKRALRLIVIGVITILLYCVIIVPIRFSSLGVPAFFKEYTYETFVDFTEHYFPNLSFIWFIFALAVCYLLFPLINKIKWFHENKFSILVPLTILVLVYVYRILAIRFDLGFFSKIEITRNFFFAGIPCFLIGTYIYDHIFEYKEIRAALFWPIIIGLFGICLIEAFLHSLISNTPNEFYLGSIAIAVLSVVYAIQHQESKIGELIYRVFGKTSYMLVYLLHVLFISLLSGPLSFDFTRLLLIFLVISIPLVLSFIYNFIKKHNQ